MPKLAWMAMVLGYVGHGGMGSMCVQGFRVWDPRGGGLDGVCMWSSCYWVAASMLRLVSQCLLSQ